MDRNFRVRVSVGIVLFAGAMLALYTFHAIPFKILYGAFSVVAAVELLSFFKNGFSRKRLVLAILELLLLICGTIFVASTDVTYFWYVILGVPGYDIFAYFFGKMLGGRIIKRSRPFPHISKNKTWEGTIMGLIIATAMVAGMMATRDAFKTEWIYLLCGPLALCGDLFESFLKRKFDVKDSNEIVIKNRVFAKIEILVGGSDGHGGFLDRIDSSAFACTVLLVLSLAV